LPRSSWRGSLKSSYAFSTSRSSTAYWENNPSPCVREYDLRYTRYLSITLYSLAATRNLVISSGESSGAFRRAKCSQARGKIIPMRNSRTKPVKLPINLKSSTNLW